MKEVKGTPRDRRRRPPKGGGGGSRAHGPEHFHRPIHIVQKSGPAARIRIRLRNGARLFFRAELGAGGVSPGCKRTSGRGGV